MIDVLLGVAAGAALLVLVWVSTRVSVWIERLVYRVVLFLGLVTLGGMGGLVLAHNYLVWPVVQEYAQAGQAVSWWWSISMDSLGAALGVAVVWAIWSLMYHRARAIRQDELEELAETPAEAGHDPAPPPEEGVDSRLITEPPRPSRRFPSLSEVPVHGAPGTEPTAIRVPADRPREEEDMTGRRTPPPPRGDGTHRPEGPVVEWEETNDHSTEPMYPDPEWPSREDDQAGEYEEEEPPEPPRRNWGRVAGMVVGGMVVTGLILLGVYFLIWAPRAGLADRQQAMRDAADQVAAESTGNALLAADPELSEFCPDGWNLDCWKAIQAADPQATFPVCTVVIKNNTQETALFKMTEECREASLRQHWDEQTAEREYTQEWDLGPVKVEVKDHNKIFESGNAININRLVVDPTLQRETILRHWTSQSVPWKILVHPSLTAADLSQIWGVVQARDWTQAEPWLVVNPKLEKNLRGAWVILPDGTPDERRYRILLGLYQPTGVPAGAVAYLVDQAIEDGTERGNTVLWNVLLEAAASGDIPAPRCRLETDKDPTRKDYPVCYKTGAAMEWDFLRQMQDAQEANPALFPAPANGWDVLRVACQGAMIGGRHSKAATEAAKAGMVTPDLVDSSPLALEPPGIYAQ